MKNILEKLLYRIFVAKYWTIGYRLKNAQGFDNNFEGGKFQLLQYLPYTTLADPHIVNYGQYTWMFYEKKRLDEPKGTIWCRRLEPFSTEESMVLAEPFHLSYPYVFRHNENFYMIPETGEAHEVRLYQCLEFPNLWEYKCTLLKANAVDTNLLFAENNVCYMYTYINEHLHIYEMVLEPANIFKVQAMKQIYVSECNLTLRGAGNIIEADGTILRPTQNCRKRYGESICFREIDLDDMESIGIQKVELCPKMIHLDGLKKHNEKIAGVHTYNQSRTYEVVDVLVEKKHWTVPFRKLYWYLKKQWRQSA